MKRHWGLIAATLAFLASACTSGPSPIAEPSTVVAETAVTEEPTSTPEPPTPTTAPVVVSDQDRLTAALAQLEADVAAGEGPGNIAYDILDQNINADGDVTLTLCTWTRDTVFNEVRDSLYRTTTTDTGDVTATHITTPLTTGDCLNTELINTAFDFIDQYDIVRAEWSQNPASFGSDPRAAMLTDPDAQVRLATTMQQLVDDNIYFEPATLGASSREDSVTPARYRRVQLDGTPLFEIVVCRQINPDFGSYRAGVLVSREQPNDPARVGPHSATSYELAAADTEYGWELLGEQTQVWANCEIDNLDAALQTWLGGDQAFSKLSP